MLKIYGADLSAPAIKVKLTANYLGLDYEYIRVKVREGEHQKPAFLSINPIGKVPAIDDGGFCLFESNAICKYLAKKAESDIYPEGVKEQAVMDAWIDFATIHVGGAMGRVVFNRIFAPVIPVDVDEKSLECGLQFLDRFLPKVEEQLGRGRHFCGEKFSLADIVLLATLDPAEAAQIDLAKYPKITAWRNDLRKQEFYTKCHANYEETLQKMMAHVQKS